jgi:hypothetical protein
MFWKRKSLAPKFKDEPEELSSLILERLEKDPQGPFDEFVEHRFWRPFEHSVKRADLYSAAFTGFTLLVIGGGVASSILSEVPGNPHTAIAIIGVAVALAAAVNRLWRPGLRAALRHRTANELRREGWNFVCEQGHYERSDDTDQEDKRIQLFFRRVEKINAPVEAIDEQEMEGKGEG